MASPNQRVELARFDIVSGYFKGKHCSLLTPTQTPLYTRLFYLLGRSEPNVTPNYAAFTRMFFFDSDPDVAERQAILCLELRPNGEVAVFCRDCGSGQPTRIYQSYEHAAANTDGVVLPPGPLVRMQPGYCVAIGGHILRLADVGRPNLPEGALRRMHDRSLKFSSPLVTAVDGLGPFPTKKKAVSSAPTNSSSSRAAADSSSSTSDGSGALSSSAATAADVNTQGPVAAVAPPSVDSDDPSAAGGSDGAGDGEIDEEAAAAPPSGAKTASHQDSLGSGSSSSSGSSSTGQQKFAGVSALPPSADGVVRYRVSESHCG